MRKVHTNKGFTLAELLIVVAVIAVLVAVAIPTFTNQLEKSRQAVDVSNLRGAYAAGRLAEMEGGVDNIKFESNSVKMATGEGKLNTPGGSTKEYTSYWYDPDTGKLSLVPVESTTSGDTTTRTLKSEFANKRFQKVSQLGKAQGTQVLADTSQLPGGGTSLAVYSSEQLAAITAYETNVNIQSGTLDRAIRVTFYKTMAGPWKLHEVRFVANANEGLTKEGTEDTLLIALATGKSYAVEAVKTTGVVTDGIALASTITVNGAAFDKDKYDVTIAVDNTANFAASTPAYANGVINATLFTDSTNDKKEGKIYVSVLDKSNHSISGTCTFTVTRAD